MNTIKKILPDPSWLYWLVPFFSFYLVSNNKTYLLVYAVFGLVLFLTQRSITHVLFYLLLLALPFERVVRSWPFEVVPFGPTYWDVGYSYFFGISIKMVVATALFILLIKKRNSFTLAPRKTINWLVIIFFGCSLVSSLFASRFDLAITGLIRLWLPLLYFFVSQVLFRQKSLDQKFDRYLVSLLLFFGFIGTLQFLKQQPLGLNMEDISNLFPLGFSTTDGEEAFRVLGFMGHPTYFGSFIALLMPVALGMFVKEILAKKSLTWTALISASAFTLGLVSTIGTFSRSSWIALALAVTIFVYKLKRNFKWKNVRNSKFLLPIGTSIIVLLVILAPKIMMRIDSFESVWTTGTGKGRLALMSHALKMAQNHPFFGVGLNHFTSAMMEQGVEREYRGFIYPVHNTFLLFLSELGVPAGLAFLLFVLILLKQTLPKVQDNLVNFGLWVGALTFVINAQFHTLFNQDPTFEMLMIILGYLATLI